MMYSKAGGAGAGSVSVGAAIGQAFGPTPAVTNLLLRSETLNVAPWVLAGGVAVTSTNNADPHGGTTLNLLTDASAVATGEANQPIAVANDATAYVVSCYVKIGGTAQRMKLGARLSGGVAVESFIELVSSSGVVATQQGTAIQSTIVVGGVTYQRLSVLITNNTSGNVTLTPYFQPASNGVGDTGNNQAGMFQVEVAPTSTSATPGQYIQTAAASVTNPGGMLPAFEQAPQIVCETYTANGNSVAPSWANRALLIGVAGGGGGGGSPVTSTQSGGAGGGGGGQRTDGTIVTVVPGTTYAVGIGTAGNGGGNNANGTAGGNTTFGALLTLLGGNGGNKSNGFLGGAGGLGGVAGQNDGQTGQYGDTTIITQTGPGGNGGGNGGLGGTTGNGQAAAANSGAGGGGSAGIGIFSGGNGGTGRLVVIYFKV